MFVVLTPRTWAEQDRAELPGLVPTGATTPTGAAVLVPGPETAYPPSVVDDALVTHAVLDTDARRRQVHALGAHQTQVSPHEDWFTLSNDLAARLPGREGYARWPEARDALARAQGVPSR